MSQDKLLDHESDGIKEYDNDLPKWWLWLFYLTILFAGIYTYHFHFRGIPTHREKLDTELAQLKVVPPPGSDGEKLNWAILASDPDVKNKGKEVFIGKCAVCHAPEGQGLVGPNLTDNHSIHGGKPDQILNTIYNGVADKGMLPWKTLLTRDELIGVAVHVLNLKGTKPVGPPTPKAPQGNLE